MPKGDRESHPHDGGPAEIDVGRSYREWQRELFNYFRRCGVPADASEDLMQETFVALLDAADRFEPSRGPLRLFLFGIARNVRRVWERRGNPRWERANGTPADFAGRPGDLEVVASVRAAVGELPEDQRETLLLREFHGFSYEEIARLQGVPIGTVRSRLARAREELRARLITGNQAPAGRKP